MPDSSLTVEQLQEAVKTYVSQKEFQQKLDLAAAPEVSFLAQGEYNINFLLTGEERRLVLRLNAGSQMDLDNQIQYEYQTLEYLTPSQVTPRPLLLDDSCQQLPLGMLVMEYLPGRNMHYEQDLEEAARVLARVHEVEVPVEHNLIVEDKPLSGIWQECSQLVPTYLNSELGQLEVKKFIERMINGLDRLRTKEADIMQVLPYSIVNTEVNSGNFIINEDREEGYLVDWEKPLVTTPLQDLSHFVVPTTTLWKTDYRLTKEDRANFLGAYCAERGLSASKRQEIKEALEIFDKFSMMRGISWPAMAWVNYQQADRMLKNEDTFRKMDMYLQPDFLADLLPEFS